MRKLTRETRHAVLAPRVRLEFEVSGNVLDMNSGAAAVYHRRDVFIVASDSYLGDGDGGSVPNGWLKTAPADMDDAALGHTVRAALAATQNNVPMPDFSRPQPHVLALYAAAGVKTERQFAKNNILVQVELQERSIELLPTRSDGQGTFHHRTDLAEVVDADVDDAALGRKIRQVLARSS